MKQAHWLIQKGFVKRQAYTPQLTLRPTACQPGGPSAQSIFFTDFLSNSKFMFRHRCESGTCDCRIGHALNHCSCVKGYLLLTLFFWKLLSMSQLVSFPHELKVQCYTANYYDILFPVLLRCNKTFFLPTLDGEFWSSHFSP